MRRIIALVALTVGFSGGCVVPECVTQNYFDPECRVVAENQGARLHTASGLEVRFQDPELNSDASWAGLGLLEEVEPGTVRARVANPGGFAISITPDVPGVATPLEVLIDNVDPRARVTLVGELVPALAASGLRRRVMVGGETTSWIRGDTPCPSRYRIAVMSDVQTNPGQFERILERLAEEVDEAAMAGEPLMALVMPGDLTESSRDDEFERFATILERAPVSVAVTAGNHDVYRPLQPHYNRTFGPGNYAFTICDTRVAMLDSGSGRIADSIEGRLPEFLDRRTADFLLLAMHHPPYAQFTGSGWSREDQAQRLLVEAALADVDLILAGHQHSLEDIAGIPVGDRELREVIAGTAGAFQGVTTPRFGYVRLVMGERIESCYVEVPPPGYAAPQGRPVSVRMPYCDP